MKTKRLLSLLLAMVMSFSLAAPVFAAEPDDPDEGIMPLMQLHREGFRMGNGSHRTTEFTSVPGYGKYIKVQFDNFADHDATVTLHRSDKYGYLELITVKANSSTDNVIWFESSDTEPVTYYVCIQGKNSYPVAGEVSVLQMRDKTSETNAGATPPMQLYLNPNVSVSGGTDDDSPFSSFAPAPGYGKCIKVQFDNNSGHDAVVELYRVGHSIPVGTTVVKAHSSTDNEISYESPNLESAYYYIRIMGKNGYPVSGSLSVLQTRGNNETGNEGAKQQQVYAQEHVTLSGGDYVGPFTAASANGKYLQVWFHNYSSEDVTVTLTGEGVKPLKSMTVPGGGQNKFVYEIPNSDMSCWYYYIRFQAQNGAQIVGDVAAAQYVNKPA